MAEMIAPDQPCPGCGGTLYRLAVPTEGSTDGDLLPGKVARCSGGCELIDGVAGAIAAPIVGEPAPETSAARPGSGALGRTYVGVLHESIP